MSDENIYIEQRRKKAEELRKKGISPYPQNIKPTHTAKEILSKYDADSKETFSVAGRILFIRSFGKAAFVKVADYTDKIQSYVEKQVIGDAQFELFKSLDVGDFLYAKGTLFRTKTNELTIKAQMIALAAKSVRPLPEKWHGLQDIEARYRPRYVDLIVTPEVRKTFIVRSKMLQILRDFFTKRDFLEVETPMMHSIPGGAAAKPFITHHNALDMQLYLRIAPELYLKRLVVGGFEKVFEINRNFRNEGLSTRHNPEFTMLEFYEAYRDYKYLMDFTESLFREVAQKVLGTTLITYQGNSLDLGKPFHRLTMVQAIQKFHQQFTTAQLNDRNFLINELEDLKAKYKPADGIGGLQLSLFEELAEGHLFEPTFIVDYPVEVSPLARSSDKNPEITERFELFIVGREIANGFSELNDAEDQAARFDAQVAAKEAGDEEAMFKDNDFVRALEYGLPPTAGEGIGIDRLVMLLTDSASIRDVILFPHMRPE